ncbi:hypothetical protein L2E82_22701 [Cichorium intybus]|uniref:Uncharacterized protein n=1 Tax=Cichorium intybus TaxID=13427 RepID=A0ACB9DYS6_CICIN|nr:hypothetical protein L2E82_22701 [Cichorium intybus]
MKLEPQVILESIVLESQVVPVIIDPDYRSTKHKLKSAELCYKEEQILSGYLIFGSSGAHNQLQYTMTNDVHRREAFGKFGFAVETGQFNLAVFCLFRRGIPSSILGARML